MTHTKITAMPFSAKITIALEKGYTQELIPKEEVIFFTQGFQSALFTDKKIGLNAAVSDCNLVFEGL